MDPARPSNPPKLLSLQETAQRLAVSVDVLRKLSEQNILMPTISDSGEVGYTEEQIEHFLQLKNSSTPHTESISTSTNHLSGRAGGHGLGERTPLPQRVLHWLGGGFYQDEYSKAYFKSQLQDSLSFKAPKLSKKLLYPSAAALALLAIFVGTQQSHIKYTIEHFSSSSNRSTTVYGTATSKAVLGEETSKLKLAGKIIFSLPLTTKSDVSIGKNLEVSGTSVFKQNITAPNVLYGMKAGDHVQISGDKQNPTVSVDLSTTVNSLQGQTGDVTLQPGEDIEINGTTISNTSTLSSVAARGDCTNCLKDAAVSDSLTIDASGQISADAIKSGTLTTSIGGTGVTEYLPGDMLYASASNTLDTLPVGASGQFLSVGLGGLPEWQNVGSFAVAVVKLNDTTISPVTNTLNFKQDFSLNVNPTGQVNIQLLPTLTSVTGVAGDFTPPAKATSPLPLIFNPTSPVVLLLNVNCEASTLIK